MRKIKREKLTAYEPALDIDGMRKELDKRRLKYI